MTDKVNLSEYFVIITEIKVTKTSIYFQTLRSKTFSKVIKRLRLNLHEPV